MGQRKKVWACYACIRRGGPHEAYYEEDIEIEVVFKRVDDDHLLNKARLRSSILDKILLFSLFLVYFQYPCYNYLINI